MIKYRKGRYSRLKLGAESFLFEEGSVELYQKAVYGGLRIDKNGNSIQTGLYERYEKMYLIGGLQNIIISEKEMRKTFSRLKKACFSANALKNKIPDNIEMHPKS